MSLRGQVMPVLRHVRGTALLATNAAPTVGRHYGGTDKYQHDYMRYYRRHFRSRRLQRLLVIEIGVGGHESEVAGGSLPLWRDYFARSQIVGLDLYEKVIDFGPRVTFEQADQNDVSALKAVIRKHGRPDIVIDDGSHVGEHIHTSFRTLWPLLKAGGTYVVEDLASSYFPHSGGGDPPPATSGLGLVSELLDSVQGRDPTFVIHPAWGSRSKPRHDDVAAVHCYPGIAFIAKA